MENKAKFVESIYKQRDKFILIGLTGRTGSGCSTVASILSKEKMTDLDLRSYKTCNYSDADERKYSVIYRFMKEGDKWKKFYVIEASSVILSFILQDNFGCLFNFLDSICEMVNISDARKLKKEIAHIFLKKEVDQIELDELKGITIHNLANRYVDLIEGKKQQSNDDIYSSDLETLEKTVDFFTVKLAEIKKELHSVLKRNTVQNKNESKFYNLYSLFMQKAGNNLRSSGLYYEADERAGKEVTLNF